MLSISFTGKIDKMNERNAVKIAFKLNCVRKTE